MKRRELKLCDTKGKGTIWQYINISSEPVLLQEDKKLKYQHPAAFPNLMAIDLIRCFSDENDTVLDPFNGSGTTCIAASIVNRNYIGIDTSSEYCKLCIERLKLYNKHKEDVLIMLEQVKRERDTYDTV